MSTETENTQKKDYIFKTLKTVASNNPDKAKEMASLKHNIPIKLLYVEETEKSYVVKRR